MIQEKYSPSCSLTVGHLEFNVEIFASRNCHGYGPYT